jgi:hypothetical protein
MGSISSQASSTFIDLDDSIVVVDERKFDGLELEGVHHR